MSFLVEDGTGVTGANSYASAAELSAYHLDRGRDLSAFTQSEMEAALIRATDYLENRFPRFVGQRCTETQGLSWPRDVSFPTRDGFDFLAVPEALKRALFEYALEALYGSLYPDGQTAAPTVAPGAGAAAAILSAPLRRERQKIGKLEQEIEYNVRAGGAAGDLRPIPRADNLIRRAGLVVNSSEIFRA